MKRKIKGFLLLGLLFCSAMISSLPSLGLLVPGAGGAIFFTSTAYGAVALAAGVAGPAGWGIFGLITLWGA